MVGTELKKLLKQFGFDGDACPVCRERAQLLDAAGPDWVESHIDITVGWLREQAHARGLPFLDAAGRMLVRRAIKNARKNAVPPLVP